MFIERKKKKRTDYRKQFYRIPGHLPIYNVSEVFLLALRNISRFQATNSAIGYMELLMVEIRELERLETGFYTICERKQKANQMLIK